MITHIDGVLEEKNPAYAVIDVNGVGYILHISLNTYSAIPDKGRVRLFTHLAIKEDAHTLYGFATRSEREMYRQLISVSGVGPSTARMILSSLSPTECANAIVSGNVLVFKQVKGIGAKSAERIIIDLKDKVSGEIYSLENLTTSDNTIKNEALSALIVLGVDKKKAEKIIADSLQKFGDDITVENLVKVALKSI
jgi:holliday junction DNA helicase RuvA